MVEITIPVKHYTINAFGQRFLCDEFSDQLGSSAKAKNAIIDAIEIVRADTLQLLLSLDQAACCG